MVVSCQGTHFRLELPGSIWFFSIRLTLSAFCSGNFYCASHLQYMPILLYSSKLQQRNPFTNASVGLHSHGRPPRRAWALTLLLLCALEPLRPAVVALQQVHAAMGRPYVDLGAILRDASSMAGCGMLVGHASRGTAQWLMRGGCKCTSYFSKIPI
jgi:hypothetical protein